VLFTSRFFGRDRVFQPFSRFGQRWKALVAGSCIAADLLLGTALAEPGFIDPGLEASGYGIIFFGFPI